MVMSKSLFVFDIDGTLCPINKPIGLRMNSILCKITRNNYLALASGKPFGYIAGFCRQLGLDNAIIIGENGGSLMLDARFPPKKYYNATLSVDLRKLFSKIRNDFEIAFGNRIWFQPNDVNLTIFPIDINDIGRIHDKAKEFSSKEMQTYFHKDSVDFVPLGVDKGVALERIMTILDIKKENVYAFGDGHNDIPMFEKAGHIITVGDLELTLKVERVVASIDEIEQLLEQLIVQQPKD